jgi:galactokinase
MMPQSPSREESPAIRLASAKLATSLFTASFGSRPGVVTSAPGSIKLMGEHTDYNGGPVLPIAVERRKAIAAGLATRWTCISTVDGEVHEVESGRPARGHWSDYLVGVIRELCVMGAAPPGADVAIADGIPANGEFASSAALTLAAAKALSLLAGRRLTPAELVGVGVRVEHELIGLHGGRVNHAIASHGRRGMAFLLESATGGIRSLPFPGRVWVMETGISPGLGDGSLTHRRRECEQALAYCREWRPGLAHLAQLSPADLEELQWRLPPPLVPRVRHVVTETARTRSAAAALAAGDLRRFGGLMVDGHESLRLDYDSSIAEANLLVGSAVANGAYGARLTGAGWGGTVILVAPPESEARILAQVSQDFQDRFGRVLQVWSTRAAAGVRREAVSRDQ